MASSQSKFNTTDLEVKENEKTNVAAATSKFRDYDENKPGEAMSVYIPAVLTDMMVRYLNADLKVDGQGDNEQEKFSSEERHQFTLFGRKVEDLLKNAKLSPEANLILRGEEKEVEEVLALVKKNPHLLEGCVVGKDPRGRLCAGTLLQIASLAGDVDLQEGIQEEKKRGLVERLAAVGQLAPEKVKEQLAVITSRKAIAENEKRNKRVLDAIKAFGEGILLKAREYKGNNVAEFQTLCQSVIDQLEKELTPNPNEVITLGYAFDLKILQQAAEWFAKNVSRFGGWRSIQSNVFWVNGFGLLQSNVSSRDAQVIRNGIGILVDDKIIPPRSLNNFDDSSYFYNSSSRLGRDFYLGYYGSVEPWGTRCGQASGLANLWRAKTRALQNLCNIRTIQNKASV